MKLTFDNRIAVVTGAGRGIGKAIAEGLAAQGVGVICVSKSENTCGAVAEGILSSGGKAQALSVDVSDFAAVKEACESLLREWKRIDLLINNAGITRDGLALRMSEDDWDSVLKTNLFSCFYWVKGLLRSMTQNRWGRIVNIASVVGLMGNAGQLNYASAKAGMIGFTKSLAKEVASRSITVNAIAPGFIATDMTEALGETITSQIKQNIPLKRMGMPQDIANMVSYLCSEEANYITGQIFTVDGGLAM